MQTLRLFDGDQYLREFDAKVIEVDGANVVLDQTAFYPESGGQAGDRGTINGFKVVDTQIIDGKHVHILEDHDLKAGDPVKCELDWERRYRTMRIHSASHIMEHYLYKHFGVMERLGSSVDDKKDRSTYVSEERLESDLLKETEDEVNAYLNEGHEISIQVDENGLRSWISGPYLDHCGGTHVRNTSEIGQIKLKRKNPGRGKERVETSLKE